MTDVVNYPYPFDPYNTPGQNEITELVPINSVVDGGYTYHYLAPRYAPFYDTSVTVKHVPTDTVLVRNVDYSYGLVYSDATIHTHRGVYGVIVVHDVMLAGDFEVQYHTIGGKYTLSDQDFIDMLANIVVDPRTIDWVNVQNTPPTFVPVDHAQGAPDVYDYNDMVEAIYAINETLLTGLQGINPKLDIDKFANRVNYDDHKPLNQFAYLNSVKTEIDASIRTEYVVGADTIDIPSLDFVNFIWNVEHQLYESKHIIAPAQQIAITNPGANNHIFLRAKYNAPAQQMDYFFCTGTPNDPAKTFDLGQPAGFTNGGFYTTNDSFLLGVLQRNSGNTGYNGFTPVYNMKDDTWVFESKAALSGYIELPLDVHCIGIELDLTCNTGGQIQFKSSGATESSYIENTTAYPYENKGKSANEPITLGANATDVVSNLHVTGNASPKASPAVLLLAMQEKLADKDNIVSSTAVSQELTLATPFSAVKSFYMNLFNANGGLHFTYRLIR